MNMRSEKQPRPARRTLAARVALFAMAWTLAMPAGHAQGVLGSSDAVRAAVLNAQSQQSVGTGTQSSVAIGATGVGSSATGSDFQVQPVDIGPSMTLPSLPLQDGSAVATGQGRQLPPQRAEVRASEASEFEKFVSDLADRPVRRFGSELLLPDARDFVTPSTASIPSDYRLNPGDQLRLNLSGSVQANEMNLTVDREGRVYIPRVGAVQVGGVAYRDLRSVLASEIGRFYRSFDIEVGITRLHGITVYVTGFAARPGAYTISSLSTLVNAVLAAGGPSAGGSFRNIILRRGDRTISNFDLYSLLLQGNKSGDSPLQNGDVIFIEPEGPSVAVLGSVNRESIYEMPEGTTVADAVQLAGGLSSVADAGRVMIYDPLKLDSGGWDELSQADARGYMLKRGDIIQILSGVGIARPLEYQPVLVTVSGEVARPGRYYFQPGATTADVLARAGGLTSRAYPYATVLTRERVRREQRESYERAIDSMQLTLTTQPLASGGTIAQISGDQIGAVRAIIDQMRKQEPDGRLVLSIAPDAKALPGDLVLENNDSLRIPSLPETVGVFGAVPSPATFRFQPGMKIGDFLKKSGDVLKLGDRGRIFVVRANGSVLAPRRGLFGGSVLNERALPGDLVFVPIDATRGQFWSRLAGLGGILTGFAGTAATIKVLTE